MTYRCGTAPILLATLLLTACGKPDAAALESTDAAFAGQQVDGELRPVASRPVLLGREAACRKVTAPGTGALTMRWSADASGPAKAEVTGDVWACESDGDWTGVVFPATGQSADDCGVSAAPRSAREYQGPCRWGWAPNSDMGLTAPTPAG